MIYSRQTKEEQKHGATFFRNRVGFNTHDAVKASLLIVAVQKTDTHLTKADLEAVRDLVTTYRIQVLDMLCDSSDVQNERARLNKTAVRRLIIGAEDTQSSSSSSQNDLLLRSREKHLPNESPKLKKMTLINPRIFMNDINVALRGALAIARPRTAECVLALARSMNPPMFQDISDYDLHFRLFDILTSGKVLEDRARENDYVYVLWEEERKWHCARVVAWMPNGEPKAILRYEVDNTEGELSEGELYWMYSL